MFGCKTDIFEDFSVNFWNVCGGIWTILAIWQRYLLWSGQFQGAEIFLRLDNYRLAGHRHFGGFSGVLWRGVSPGLRLRHSYVPFWITHTISGSCSIDLSLELYYYIVLICLAFPLYIFVSISVFETVSLPVYSHLVFPVWEKYPNRLPEGQEWNDLIKVFTNYN